METINSFVSRVGKEITCSNNWSICTRSNFLGNLSINHFPNRIYNPCFQMILNIHETRSNTVKVVGDIHWKMQHVLLQPPPDNRSVYPPIYSFRTVWPRRLFHLSNASVRERGIRLEVFLNELTRAEWISRDCLVAPNRPESSTMVGCTTRHMPPLLL